MLPLLNGSEELPSVNDSAVLVLSQEIFKIPGPLLIFFSLKLFSTLDA